MAIGGGTFTVQNKVLPGTYINFISQAQTVSTAERGTVALPLPLHWGAEQTLMTLTADGFAQDCQAMLGYSSMDGNLLLVRQALLHGETLLLYRADTGGVRASVSGTNFTATAKYTGIRGNDLQVSIVADDSDSTRVDVVTYLEGTEMDRQSTTKTSATLADNDYVTFQVSGTLSAVAALTLTGGTDGTATTQSYADFLDLLEPESFDVVGYPGTDSEVKALVSAFAKRLYNEEGKLIVGVLANEETADSVAVISVGNGVVLSDGTVLSAADAVCWVAGASAGAQVYESLTNMAYDDAVDVDTKYTVSQYEAAVNAGQFVFYAYAGTARVLSDINTLTSFTSDTSEDWCSNRVVRVMSGWASEVASIFVNQYLGTQTNSDTGHNLFKADLVALGKEYEAMDAISDFSANDLSVTQGDGKRDVVVTCALKPNDSMEKLYMSVSVY